jgi:ribosome-associated protein
LRLQGSELAHTLVDIIIDKKGSNIILLDIREQAVFADYFVICTGESDRQARAIIEAVLEGVARNAAASPLGIEGEPEHGWILADFGDVVMHVFSPEKRAYYSLEELWSAGHVMLRIQ